LATLDRIAPDRSDTDRPLRGQLLLALGRWDEASRLFEAALDDEPDLAALWFNLGYALWAGGGAPPRAVQCLARAAELEPTNPRIRRHLALAQEAAGDLPAALRTLAAAVETGTADSALFVLQSQLELDSGNVPGAQAAAERAVASEPGSASAWQAKGQAALFALDAQTAAQALRQSLDLDNNDADTHVLLAQASLMLGRSHQARRLIAALEDRGAADAAAICMAGWACCAEDDIQAARAAFEKALAQDCESPDALAGLACVLLAGGDRDTARRMAERAMTLEPEHLVATLVSTQCDASASGAGSDNAVVKAALARMPFGPLNVSLGQALAMPEVATAAQHLQRRYRRLKKQTGPSNPSHRASRP
jgi:tetratricopeptide (TPR) repeat protein